MIGDHIEWDMPSERIASLLLSRKELERADRKGVDDTNRYVECLLNAVDVGMG